MEVDALAAILFGHFFDRKGLSVITVAVCLSAFFAPLVFLGNFNSCLAGMIFWGVGMGAQESIMRAAVVGMVPTSKRGTACGLFNTGYGIFWFLGSALMGFLYDFWMPALIIFSVEIQLASLSLIDSVGKKRET
jgi:predicted MFS family arabinose efflux permease